MYDARNRQPRTQLNHYLRTGKILPEEQFIKQKSNLEAYSEDDFLSYKSWNTLDFWNHYKNGRGRTVNLDDIGLLGRFQNSRSVRQAVNEFQDRQENIARQKAMEICRGANTGEKTVQFEAFSDRNNTVTDVTLDVLRLFSVGRSSFFRSARSVIGVNCDKRTIRLEGVMNFSIDDAFVDAIDVFNWVDGDQDLEGGAPYKIGANWSKKFIWGGKF